MTRESKMCKVSFTEVGGRYNGPAIEKEILEFWRARDIFNKSLKQREGCPRFSFNEGPPTANGKPGIHHVLARTFKDIYPRYKTMRGFYAPRRGGWDTHGLPVEHEIEKQLGIFDKKEIEKQIGVAEFTRRCRESVMAYIGEWEAMTRRMGYWVDLDDAYFTLDNNYIESVWHLLKTIWDKGLIYKDYKVVPYDPRIGATLSSHEVAQGYREVDDPSITVRFALLDEENAAFLVWTTTPWTLPANLLLAIAPDVDYARVAFDADGKDEILIVAAARVAEVFGERPHRVIDTIKGGELVGRRYRRPFDYLRVDDEDKICRVVAADFVSVDDGTGIVHCAPAYGVDDLALGRREGVPVIHGVDLDGCLKPEVTPVAGMFFKDADKVINRLLRERGLMFTHETRRHNYPFGWRTGDPLIYYAKEAWYIRTAKIKSRMVALNKTIYWVPPGIRDGRFGKWLENNIDWALSRERFWGTPLPLWSDGEGDFICIGSLAELEQLTGRALGELDLHRPDIDAITFTRDGREYRRVPEVIDCWFDSGAMTYAQWHYPFANREEFAKHFPADYICEAIDQTRGWFYTLHAIAALVDDSVAFKHCVCLSHIVDAEGRKMSKSQGNIVDPADVFDKVGADALRWLFLARSAPDAQKRISVDIVREVAASFVNTLWNTYAFFVLYARLDDIDLTRPVPYTRRAEIDRWILALAHATVKTAGECLDKYDAKGAGECIEKLVDQLSNWYVRRNRRRFWKSEVGDDKQAAYLTLHEVLRIVTRLIAPFMPFLSEAMHQNLRLASPDDAESVHLTEWPAFDRARLDPQLVFEFDAVQQLVGLGRTCREQSRVRVRQPLSRLLAATPDARARDAIVKHKAQILEELNVKALEWIEPDAQLVEYALRPNFQALGKKYGKRTPIIARAIAQADAAAVAAKTAAGEGWELQVDGDAIALSDEDFQIQSAFAGNYSGAEGGGFLAALDTTLTEDLQTEGIAREIVRTVQDARKAAGLDIAERILLQVGGSARVMRARELHADYILGETLALGWRDATGDAPTFGAEKSLGEDHWRIDFVRASV